MIVCFRGWVHIAGIEVSLYIISQSWPVIFSGDKFANLLDSKVTY